MDLADVGLRNPGESLRNAISCSLDLAGLRYADRGERVRVDESTNRIVRRLARSLDYREGVAIRCEWPAIMRENQAAEYLGVSSKTLKRWCVIEGVPHRKVADKRLYCREALDQWAGGVNGKRADR